MNIELKSRAERIYNKTCGFSLHPVVDKGHFREAGSNIEAVGKLHCHCVREKIEISVSERSSHNHLCGCSICWKPQGALFSQVAVVPTDSLEVTANGHKLAVVDPVATIRRYACQMCGVHMYGRVDDSNNHYYGMDFVHLELAENQSNSPPEFAGYVSSLIESGVNPSEMASIRRALSEKDIDCYDVLSPELMDVISFHRRKINGL
ncbi:S-(hydroxymethyl)glutathione synthase [Pseudomaricurvus alkylphenolicus]|nr:S-(hydroxymethyl)glutathione synthase [Pseudomaricurvus alkylphenolicus]